MTSKPIDLSSVEDCVDQVISRVGKDIVLGVPLGLGKPNQLVNALYRRASNDGSIKLRIMTALSLEKPQAHDELEAKFLNPFVERVFGNYVELDYVAAVRRDTLPENITVSEFYFKAGAMINVAQAQRHYMATNYTFAARDLIDNNVNVLAQLVSEREINGERQLSLSCNTDISLELLPLMEAERRKGKNNVIIAQVHDDLPFMKNDAVVGPDCFDFIIKNADYNTTLFAPPNMAVSTQDYVTGLYASSLIKDGGTLQIGIGALSDAIVYACQLRHKHNEDYRAILHALGIDEALVSTVGGVDRFDRGLYGSSEMFVNGFMHLIQDGILKRQVFDDLPIQTLVNEAGQDRISPETLRGLLEQNVVSSPLSLDDVEYLKRWGVFSDRVQWQEGELVVDDKVLRSHINCADQYDAIVAACSGDGFRHGVIMHGGFFLGPQSFYRALKEMKTEENEKICMTSVQKVNQLYDDVPLQIAQRQHARFINTGIMVTLGGAVVSDGIETGQVISGVGGQYNFVAMAHSLPGARSILCIRSTRGEGKAMTSNIVPHYGHITIPRHLRDIVVTEYGVANLRGKTDEQIIQALISIADSHFQMELVETAVSYGKLNPTWEIPVQFRNNTVERIEQSLQTWQEKLYFPAFPLGSDFTEEEIALGKSLKEIKALMGAPKTFIRTVVKSLFHQVDEQEAERFLKRIGLLHPDTPKEVLIKRLLLLELEENGYLKPL